MKWSVKQLLSAAGVQEDAPKETGKKQFKDKIDPMKIQEAC